MELLRGVVAGLAYDRHRHDTYAIGLTEIGVQAFDYRGAPKSACQARWWCCTRTSRTTAAPGPRTGSATGSVYVEPARIYRGRGAISLGAGGGALPFVRSR